MSAMLVVTICRNEKKGENNKISFLNLILYNELSYQLIIYAIECDSEPKY